ncbi:hypothetical protein A2U01_0106277, partial [Trifolium medium]|nr:hypothetical protein [Trifolium medium]
MSHVLGNLSADVGDKLVSIPKKRLRIDQSAHAEDAEVEEDRVLVLEEMLVDNPNEGLRAADL